MAESKKTIQERMLGNINNDYDKTPGSFFYDAIKPVAIELEKLDIKADEILNKGFVDTAKEMDLERITGEIGVYRKPATKSFGVVTITGIADAEIVADDKVSSDNANFIFIENKIIPVGGIINVSVECEQYGTIGNVPVGAIKYFPMTIEGLQTVINNQSFTNGYEAESDDILRDRYYTKIQTPATSGNKYHYLNWAKEVLGVGDARIFPLWSGAGTVKVVIINSNKRVADGTLITNVAEHIEEERPIGATVTVVSATEKTINVTMTLVIDLVNYTALGVQAAIESNLTDHFKNIAFKANYVSYAQIGNIIFDTPGVIDYSNLKINTGTSNITIADTEVAVLGGVTVG